MITANNRNIGGTHPQFGKCVISKSIQRDIKSIKVEENMESELLRTFADAVKSGRFRPSVVTNPENLQTQSSFLQLFNDKSELRTGKFTDFSRGLNAQETLRFEDIYRPQNTIVAHNYTPSSPIFDRITINTDEVGHGVKQIHFVKPPQKSNIFAKYKDLDAALKKKHHSTSEQDNPLRKFFDCLSEILRNK